MSSKDKKEKKDKKDKKDKKKDKKESAAPAPAAPPAASSTTPGGPPAPVVSMGEDKVADGLITIRVVPECPYVLRGVSSSLNINFEISTGARPDRKARAPLSLAIVLDRSGSMGGSKLMHSKTAVIETIRNLSPDDVVHFVAYDTQVTTVFENSSPREVDRLVALVQSVNAGSSTNLEGGLVRGGELLKKYKRPGHVTKMFIFSDGLANCGKTEDKQLFDLVRTIHDDSITTSAFGIGNDFSENTMRGLAEHGSGHYFYLNEPNNIPKYVAKALNDSLMVLGQNAVLKLRGRGVSIVKKVYDHPDLVAGAQLKDLRESNLRNVTAVLALTPGSKEPEVGEILGWELSYQTPENATKAIKGTLHIKFTDDDQLLKKTNDEVTVAAHCQEAAAMDVQVGELVRAGRYDEAYLQKSIAVQLLQEVLAKDTKGFVSVLLQKAQSHLTDIKNRKDPEKLTKAINYDGYLARRLSFCAMREMEISSEPAADLSSSPPSAPVPVVNANRQRRLS